MYDHVSGDKCVQLEHELFEFVHILVNIASLSDVFKRSQQFSFSVFIFENYIHFCKQVIELEYTKCDST